MQKEMTLWMYNFDNRNLTTVYKYNALTKNF